MKHVAIVGCGDIAARHAKTLQGKAKISFCSRDLTKAKQYQSRFRGENAYQGLPQALQDDRLDAIILCSPPDQHKQQLMACIQANKHTLVEKPLTTTPEDLQQIVDATANVAHLCIMVAENYYYKPSLRVLQQWMAQPNFGKLQKVVLRKMFTQKSQGWKAKHGALLEGGIHYVALLSALVGMQAPTHIQSDIVLSDHQPERTSHVYATYAQDLQAEIHYSWATPQATFGLLEHSKLIGSKSTITFESNGLYAHNGWKFKLGPFKDITGSQAMMDDFLTNITQPNPQPRSSIQAAARDLNLVFQAYGL